MNINFVSVNRKQKQHSHGKRIGMGPLNGYEQITKEELRSLKRLTKKEARIQTEILVKAMKWFG